MTLGPGGRCHCRPLRFEWTCGPDDHLAVNVVGGGAGDDADTLLSGQEDCAPPARSTCQLIHSAKQRAQGRRSLTLWKAVRRSRSSEMESGFVRRPLYDACSRPTGARDWPWITLCLSLVQTELPGVIGVQSFEVQSSSADLRTRCLSSGLFILDSEKRTW